MDVLDHYREVAPLKDSDQDLLKQMVSSRLFEAAIKTILAEMEGELVNTALVDDDKLDNLRRARDQLRGAVIVVEKLHILAGAE